MVQHSYTLGAYGSWRVEIYTCLGELPFQTGLWNMGTVWLSAAVSATTSVIGDTFLICTSLTACASQPGADVSPVRGGGAG